MEPEKIIDGVLCEANGGKLSAEELTTMLLKLRVIHADIKNKCVTYVAALRQAHEQIEWGLKRSHGG